MDELIFRGFITTTITMVILLVAWASGGITLMHIIAAAIIIQVMSCLVWYFADNNMYNSIKNILRTRKERYERE